MEYYYCTRKYWTGFVVWCLEQEIGTEDVTCILFGLKLVTDTIRESHSKKDKRHGLVAVYVQVEAIRKSQLLFRKYLNAETLGK